MASSEDALLPREWREIQWDSRYLLKKLQEYKTDNERVHKANMLLVFSESITDDSWRFIRRVIFPFHTHLHGTTDKNYTVKTATITYLDRLHYLLDGNVPPETPVDLSSVTPSHSDFESKPTLKDKMHCVAYVVNGSDVDVDPDGFKREYDALHALTSVRGIRVVIVVEGITHVCIEVGKGLRNVHRSVKIKQIVDKISKLTGIPISSIFLIDSSYTTIDETVMTLEYTFILKMLDNAQEYLETQTLEMPAPLEIHKYTKESQTLKMPAPLGIQKYTKETQTLMMREPLDIQKYTKGKGLCLILNFFSDDRKGSQHDVECLQVFWESVGCCVKVGIDLEKSVVLKTLKDSRRDLNKPDNNYSYFVCVVMSHGDQMGICTMGGRQITVTKILDVFKNDKKDGFCGKPKLFFIQACQGDEKQTGRKVATDTYRPVPDPLTDKVPTDADILLTIATTPGYVAYRDEEGGSWLIQELIRHLKLHHETEHLEYILLSVRHSIGLKYETDEGYKQMPCTFSTLTKPFYV